MAAKTSFQIPGLRRGEQSKLEEAVRRGIGARPGRWRVQFIGSADEDTWEMCVSGPALEASELLDAAAAKQDADYVASAVARIAGG